MIVYDLHCTHGHRFEGWFGSSADFEDQNARGLVACPECGSQTIGKAPMAPAVPAKGREARGRGSAEAQGDMLESAEPAQQVSNTPMPSEVREAMNALAKAQAKALRGSTWVGSDFAEQSRAMHYGEREEAAIHGQTSLEEAKSLIDEGVPVAPLPFPVAPPEDLN